MSSIFLLLVLVLVLMLQHTSSDDQELKSPIELGLSPSGFLLSFLAH